MAAKAETLLRQQYLVPRKSVHKLQELSRLKGVSVGEVARRAIEAYTSDAAPRDSEEERVALSLLEELHAKVAATLVRIETRLEETRARERALADGSFSARIKEQITQSLLARPGEIDAVRAILSPAGRA